ncbi:hypothetical protein HJC23_004241 [Cyclotella cryptica]|uniref:SPX domain-containing protein n=1 Tax=Cyclotella cryptica TaxID=29204 RepID=A0ABD3Q8X9_9STRA
MPSTKHQSCASIIAVVPSAVPVSSVATAANEAAAITTALTSLAFKVELEESQIHSGNVTLSNLSGSPRPAFVDSFEAEFDRATDAIKASDHLLESNVRAILLSADALARKGDCGEKCDEANIHGFRLKAKEVVEQALKNKAQTASYAQEFLRIAQLADSKLGTILVATTERRLESEPWKSKQDGLTIVLLSDMYSAIREIEAKINSAGADESSKDATWVAPSSFERVTTKYWLKEQDLFRVILASVAELPLLVYGRKGGRILDSKQPQPDTDLWTSLASTISSVYFDSPGMKMYSERIKRNEGAQLFRIRWYGKKPTGDDIIFLELKTHHEKWIENNSVKERCGIQEKFVPKLLDVSSGKWDVQTAYDIVRISNPSENKEVLLKLTRVLLQIRKLVCKYKLTPCVRTKYNRVALQSASNNKLRLTIDRDITMINERARNETSKSWCLEDDDAIPTNAVVKMPYCVFEVKVAGGDTPPFITELQDSGVIVEAKKFSKFLSGASLFNVSKVKTLPWWASDDAFAPLFDKNGSNSLQPLSKSCGLSVSVQSKDTPSLTVTCTSSERSVDKSKTTRVRRILPSLSVLRGDQQEASTLEKLVASKAPTRVEPKSYFANERTFIQWISAALLFITISEILYILGSQTNNPEASIAGFFTTTMALIIAVYSVCIYYRRIYLMKNGKPYGYSDFVGPGVLTASVITGIILLKVYSHKSLPRPAAVTMSHQYGQCIQRGMNGISIMEMQPSGVALDEEKNVLLIPSLNRIIALPSGLPTEEENIKAVEIVASIRGANLEALAYVDDRIYALSEERDRSEIIYLEWKDEQQDSRQLVEVHRWEIDLIGAEAMALVPSEGDAKPKLVVAGDLMSSTSATTTVGTNRLSIDVFELDSFDLNATKVKASSKMNSALVSKGLLDGKVGDMQYFEGLLYMVFDNDRVIRAFDTKTGQVVQETTLPVAVEGSEREWEGMYFQRINNVSSGGLRGSTSGSGDLVLHLALDTPGQVWSLKLDEMDGNSPAPRWNLPQCAV